MPNLDAEYRDKTSPVWDLSQERALLEQIVSQRSHFYLIFVSIMVAAALNSKTQAHLQVLLGVGAIFSWLVALGTLRTSERLDAILADLAQDPTHPVAIVNKALKRAERGRASYRGALVVPCIVLSIVAVGALVGVVRV